MSKNDLEELLLEKMIDPVEAAISEAIASEATISNAVAPEIVSAMEVAPFVPSAEVAQA